jgi:MFS family permease
MALCAISHFNRVSISVAGNDRIMPDYGISETQMGFVYTSFLVVYSLAMIPGGLFIDRFGPRRALLLVGFGSAIFGALTGVAGWFCQSASGLLLALPLVRGTMGLVSAPLHPASARAVGNWFAPNQRSQVNGIITAAAIAGVASSYPGFGLLQTRLGWPASFVLSAAATALLTLGWAWYATDAPNTSPVPASVSRLTSLPARNRWRTIVNNRSLLLVTLSYAAIGYFQYLFVYWTQYYFDKVLHLGADKSKGYASALQIALAVAMPLGGLMADKLALVWGTRRSRAVVAGGGMLLSALCLAGGVYAKDPTAIVFWFAMANAAVGAAEGPFWATAVDLGRGQGGTAAAVCNTGGNLGGLLSPVLTPWISGLLGWGYGLGLGGVICLLGALCWCWIDPGEPSEDSPAPVGPVRQAQGKP